MGTDAKSKAVIESAQRHMEWDGLMPVADAFRNGNPAFADRAVSGTEGVPVIADLVDPGQEPRRALLRLAECDAGRLRVRGRRQLLHRGHHRVLRRRLRQVGADPGW